MYKGVFFAQTYCILILKIMFLYFAVALFFGIYFDCACLYISMQKEIFTTLYIALYFTSVHFFFTFIL